MLEGLDRLPAVLAGRLPAGTVRTRVRVERVVASESGVVVLARRSGGEPGEGEIVRLRADRVILTLPPPILNDLVIDPFPAWKREALSRLRMGAVVKLSLRFGRAFW